MKTVEQPALLPENTVIQERSVTIKVLTVGTKQVTQSLYKQLPSSEALLDDDGFIKGHVWGWVNLHIDCELASPHLHVIWEHDGALNRSLAIPEKRGTRWRSLLYDLESVMTAYVYMVALEDRRFKDKNGKNLDESSISFMVKGWRVSIEPGDTVRELWKMPERIKYSQDRMESMPSESRQYYASEVEKCKQRIPELQKAIQDSMVEIWVKELLSKEDIMTTVPSSSEEVYALAEVYADKMTAYTQNCFQSYKAIQEKGQLFIAVSGVWK